MCLPHAVRQPRDCHSPARAWLSGEATGSSWHHTYFLGLLARIAQDAGKSVEALSLLETALAMADRTGERWFEAELHRLKGQCLITHQQGDLRGS